MSKTIDGKAVSAAIKSRVKEQAESFYKEYGRRIGLAVIQVGNDPASEIYVRNKVTACEECGLVSFSYKFDSATQDELSELIDALNTDDRVDGILVQLPLPAGIDERSVLSKILPQKDVDGFHVVNAGKLLCGDRSGTVACTPRGIMELIKSTGTDVSGKHAVVVGRSNIVGKPVAQLLLAEDATVTVCHSKTQDLKAFTSSADILVVAVGKKNFISADMVKPGAIVIDVGINRDGSGLHGDVDYAQVSKVAGYITPVPGGVGPMTIAMLLLNTVEAALR